jgi:hypothetical protein
VKELFVVLSAVGVSMHLAAWPLRPWEATTVGTWLAAGVSGKRTTAVEKPGVGGCVPRSVTYEMR